MEDECNVIKQKFGESTDYILVLTTQCVYATLARWRQTLFEVGKEEAMSLKPSDCLDGEVDIIIMKVVEL
eukprot:10251568-Ditylum_brightwellii.AAC.1